MATKYNHYARELQAAFVKFREEFSEAVAAFEAAKKAKETAGTSEVARARANAEFLAAQEKFKVARNRVRDELNSRRMELREKLQKELEANYITSPDAVDERAIELMRSGIMKANDYFSLMDKYDDNSTMLRLIAKYAKDAVEDTDDRAEKTALREIADICRNGQGSVLRNWDTLSKIVDYCSGQAHEREERPTYVVSMGKRWEELSGEIVRGF